VQVQIQRLSEPWEKCGDGGEFVNYYNRQYTVAVSHVL
jgi:hypothetical protein